jgi:Transposase IS116/IS110/IS902 family
VWAVEGCAGIGRHIAQRLVADGEPVLDVPAKLSAPVRVFDTGSSLTELNGIGPSGAARLIADIATIGQFHTASHFASWNGTAPIEAFSGDQRRHRLSRLGNRRINRILHIMAVVQLRHDTAGRAYYRRRLGEGKTTMEALRAFNATCPTWSMSRWSATPNQPAPAGRVREDTRERLCNPARTAQSRQPPLRTSHSPDPPPTRVEQPRRVPLTERGTRCGRSIMPRRRAHEPMANLSTVDSVRPV